MERAKRVSVWIGAGFALLFSVTFLVFLLVPAVAEMFPKSILGRNTLITLFIGALSPAAFALALHQPEDRQILPNKPLNAWLVVGAMTALGTAQYATVFIQLLDLRVTDFLGGSASLLMVYWGGFTVMVAALLALLWQLKPSGIPRTR